MELLAILFAGLGVSFLAIALSISANLYDSDDMKACFLCFAVGVGCLFISGKLLIESPLFTPTVQLDKATVEAECKEHCMDVLVENAECLSEDNQEDLKQLLRDRRYQYTPMELFEKQVYGILDEDTLQVMKLKQDVEDIIDNYKEMLELGR